MASHSQDDGFHEIQLNGKQLVFLFMAATVVSVVIFLCGVLVGRGVRVERGAEELAALGDVPSAELAVAGRAAPALDGEREAEAPVPDIQGLSYPQRLEGAAGDTFKPVSATPESTPARREVPTEPAAVAPAKPMAAKPEAAAAPEARAAASAPAGNVGQAVPSGQNWVVQIAALNTRNDAEAIARRLSNKGYSAYVATPPDGSPVVFRVRVGPFKTRREADSMAGRLQKEEKYKPWVTR